MGEFRKVLWTLVAAVVVVLGVKAPPVVADFKSTFLINRSLYSTLSYMSDDRSDDWRTKVEDKIIANGDTHVDMLFRNTDKEWGTINAIDSIDWNRRLDRLRDKKLAPVVWFRGDDSEEIDQQTFSSQLDYNDGIIDSVDEKASHYVLGIETDEYYSPQEHSVIIQRARLKTNKPIGVHLSPTSKFTDEQVRSYIRDADIWYVQTGFNLSEAEFRAEIERAIRIADGKPIVISEYNVEGTSAEARRFGSIACEYAGKGNIIGTGNGRAGGTCKNLEWALAGGKQKEEWYEKYDDELQVMALILVTLSSIQLLDLPFTAKYNYLNEGGYEVLMMAPVTEDLEAGLSFANSGKTMAVVSGNFGFFTKLFKRGNKKSTTNEDRR